MLETNNGVKNAKSNGQFNPFNRSRRNRFRLPSSSSNFSGDQMNTKFTVSQSGSDLKVSIHHNNNLVAVKYYSTLDAVKAAKPELLAMVEKIQSQIKEAEAFLNAEEVEQRPWTDEN